MTQLKNYNCTSTAIILEVINEANWPERLFVPFSSIVFMRQRDDELEINTITETIRLKSQGQEVSALFAELLKLMTFMLETA